MALILPSPQPTHSLRVDPNDRRLLVLDKDTNELGEHARLLFLLTQLRPKPKPGLASIRHASLLSPFPAMTRCHFKVCLPRRLAGPPRLTPVPENVLFTPAELKMELHGQFVNKDSISTHITVELKSILGLELASYYVELVIPSETTFTYTYHVKLASNEFQSEPLSILVQDQCIFVEDELFPAQTGLSVYCTLILPAADAESPVAVEMTSPLATETARLSRQAWRRTSDPEKEKEKEDIKLHHCLLPLANRRDSLSLTLVGSEAKATAATPVGLFSRNAGEHLITLGGLVFLLQFQLLLPYANPLNLTLPNPNPSRRFARVSRLVGHRGLGASSCRSEMGPTLLEENTLLGFQAASQLGVRFVEFDVQLTKDNEVVVYHDLLISGSDGVLQAIRSISLAQLQTLRPARPTPRNSPLRRSHSRSPDRSSSPRHANADRKGRAKTQSPRLGHTEPAPLLSQLFQFVPLQVFFPTPPPLFSLAG